MPYRRRTVQMGGETFQVPVLNRHWVVYIIAAIVVLIILATTLYQVGADEVGVIKRFGKYVTVRVRQALVARSRRKQARPASRSRWLAIEGTRSYRLSPVLRATRQTNSAFPVRMGSE